MKPDSLTLRAYLRYLRQRYGSRIHGAHLNGQTDLRVDEVYPGHTFDGIRMTDILGLKELPAVVVEIFGDTFRLVVVDKKNGWSTPYHEVRLVWSKPLYPPWRIING